MRASVLRATFAKPATTRQELQREDDDRKTRRGCGADDLDDSPTAPAPTDAAAPSARARPTDLHDSRLHPL